jgi:hypothetical protein
MILSRKRLPFREEVGISSSDDIRKRQRNRRSNRVAYDRQGRLPFRSSPSRENFKKLNPFIRYVNKKTGRLLT